MDESLLQQGLDLMLFGMLTVVLFLSLLVFATSALSALVRRFGPPAPVLAPTAATRAGAAPADGPSPAVVAAITAAIARHRHVTATQRASSTVATATYATATDTAATHTAATGAAATDKEGP
jgi:oxaloacetate decarboxylase gamma subunit